MVPLLGLEVRLGALIVLFPRGTACFQGLEVIDGHGLGVFHNGVSFEIHGSGNVTESERIHLDVRRGLR